VLSAPGSLVMTQSFEQLRQDLADADDAGAMARERSDEFHWEPGIFLPGALPPLRASYVAIHIIGADVAVPHVRHSHHRDGGREHGDQHPRRTATRTDRFCAEPSPPPVLPAPSSDDPALSCDTGSIGRYRTPMPPWISATLYRVGVRGTVRRGGGGGGGDDWLHRRQG
jgi:hypothetical protein